MKKFLLFAAATIIALSATAANHKSLPKAQITKEGRISIATPGAFKSWTVKQNVENAFYNLSNKTNNISSIKASRRADDELELVPTYSEIVYIYSSIMGSELKMSMYDGASFLIKEDGKAYLAPFANLGKVEGVLDETAENPFAEYDAVVYTFTCGVIASFTDKTTGTKTDLTLGICDFTGSSEEGWTPVRTTETTFPAYYIAEYDELYIPAALALFEADETKTDIFDDNYLVEGLDLQPQENFNQYISKGTFTATSYFDEVPTPQTGDCKILLGNSAYYVLGVCPGASEAWAQFAFDKEDESMLHVKDYQYLSTGYFYNDDTKTDVHSGIIVTMSTKVEDGQITNWSDNGEADFKLTDNDDQTTTLKSVATGLGSYVFMEEGYKGGNWDQLDLSVTILYEPATGIANVESKSSKKTSAIYNLNGQKVNESAKGLLIRDGKKFIAK